MQGVYIPINYIPGDSIIHKIAPIPKFIWVLGFLLIGFSTRNPAILGALVLFGFIMVFVAKVWKPFTIAFIIWIPLAFTTFFFQGIAPAFPRPWEPIFSFGPFTVYQIGLYSGLTLVLRAWAVTIVALVSIFTTHPGDLFTSLQKLGMPFELNFILTMTLQLIPILQNELYVVLSAQKSRGLKGTGFGALIPSMVPVFAGTIERVSQLSIGLESKAFGSKTKKTSYRNISMYPKDYIILVIGALVSAAITYWIFVDKSLDWSRTFLFPKPVAIAMITVAVLGFLTYMIFVIYILIKV